MNKDELKHLPAYSPDNPEEITRKQFMTRVSLSIAAISAAVMAVPCIAALVAPLLESKPSSWRTVGHVGDFPVGTTRLVSFENADSEPYAGMLAKSAAWLRRTDEDTYTAFAVNCTHLGCPVRWEEKAQLFMCPCHGGVYYSDGSVAAGPPPRRLPEYKVRVRNNEIQLETAPLPITSI
ncbi:MAG TPA: Rieske (2Fe-2S) protein [Puia sp.]|nr:Rieske (2Fe-2S) protein [Puia sp.]